LGTSEFLSLFYRYNYIYRPIGKDGTWLTANSGWELSDTEILKAVACAHPRFLLGTRAGKVSRLAVLDIDAQSQYHNNRQLKRLLQVLSAAGLDKSVLFRSSRSNGWHLYFFFSEPINSRDLHKRINELLVFQGFTVARGQLEVFPNPGQPGSLGYGLRLPLQPGFAWLDKETQEVLYERDDLHAVEAMGMFCADYHEYLNSYEDFLRFKHCVEDLPQRKSLAILSRSIVKTGKSVSPVVPIRPCQNEPADNEHLMSVRGIFQGILPPGINIETWLAGRNFYETGLTCPGQRAEALFSLSHYFFYGDPQRGLQSLGYGYEEERRWLIEKILHEKHNDCSNDINNARADAYRQIERAAHWLPPWRKNSLKVKYEPVLPAVWHSANQKRKHDARKKICTALADLRATGRFSVRQLWQRSGCSMDTLYRNQDLWRVEYEDLATGVFAADPVVYNDVGVPRSCSLPVAPYLLFAVPLFGHISGTACCQLPEQRKDQREKRVLNAITGMKRAADLERWKALVLSAIEESVDLYGILPKLRTILAFLIFVLMLPVSEETAIGLHSAIGALEVRIGKQLRAYSHERIKEGRPPPAG
jgi:hypothetical protein